MRALNPAAFPRDASLIDAQGRLMSRDEIIAGHRPSSPALPLDVSVPCRLPAVAAADLDRAGRCDRHARLQPHHGWRVASLAALTLRHRIPRTSANSFEPYFHPRMLAFGVGLLAVAAVLRRRTWLAIALVGVSGLIHVTTGLWFAVMMGVAMVYLDPNLRRLAMAGAAAAAVFIVWAGIAGPLRDSFVTMDPPWLEAVAGKDLFAAEWPVWAWASNLGSSSSRGRRTDGKKTGLSLVP